MWVAIVGSRELGECVCDEQEKHFPPTEAEVAHQRVCRRLAAAALMRRVVTKLGRREGLEGLVSGGARGADTMAKEAYEQIIRPVAPQVQFLELKVKPGPESFAYRAQLRNQRVVDKADELIAVYAPGADSHGTTDAVLRAMVKGIPVSTWNGHQWKSWNNDREEHPE